MRIRIKINVLRPLRPVVFTWLEMRGLKLYVLSSMKGFSFSVTYVVSVDILHRNVLEKRNTLRRVT